MRYRELLLGLLALVAIAIAACSGSSAPSSSVPASSSNATTQTYAVNTTQGFTLAAPAFDGNTALIQFLAASSGGSANGSMSVMSTGTLPNGFQPLSKARFTASSRRPMDFTYAGQQYYVIIPSLPVTFPMAPSFTVTLASLIPGAGYFIGYYDPTIPGWNIDETGVIQGTPGPQATNVSVVFTPAAVASPLVMSTSGSTFALVAITGTTPTPVPTPTPPPASLPNLIADPNFATEGAANAFSANSSGWSPCFNPEETPTPAATLLPTPIPTASTQAGPGVYPGDTYAALTGATIVYATGPHEPRGAQGICQAITIPANPYMWMYVMEGGNDSSTYIRQEASLIIGGTLAATGASTPSNPVYTVTGATAEVSLFQDYYCTGPEGGQPFNNCNGGVSSGPAQWIMKGPYTTVLQPYAGQTVTLFIGVYASSYSSSKNYGVWMYVDGVDLVNLP